MKNIAEVATRKIYFSSPPSVQRLIFYLLPSRRLFKKQVRNIEENQWLSPQKLEQLQSEKLRRIIHHSYENVPYYRRIFDELGLKPGDIAHKDDLKKLPLLNKDDIRQHFRELQAMNIKRYEPYLRQTGGSTGKPLEFYNDKIFRWEESLVIARFKHWMRLGYEHPKRIVMRYKNDFPPCGEDTAPHEHVDNNLYLSAFHMKGSNLDDYVNRIREFKPQIIWTYPSALYVLAQYMVEQRLPPIVSVKAITTSAETLLPHARNTIEEAFGAKVYDRYGSNEGVVSVCECPCGSLHVDVEYGIFEVVDADGKPVPTGKSGIVVGTSLNKFAMPLIRYRLGDMATLSDKKCACGRGLPVIAALEGRLDDLIVTKDGRLVGRLDDAFHKSFGIMMSQIVQEEAGRILVRIVKRPDYSEDDTKILDSELRRFLGQDMTIDYKFVKDIERVGIGKYRFVISKLDVARLYR